MSLTSSSAKKSSLLDLWRPLPSVFVRIKSTHSKQKPCVFRPSVATVRQVWVKRPLPPPNSLRTDLSSHFAALERSHVQQEYQVVRCILFFVQFVLWFSATLRFSNEYGCPCIEHASCPVFRVWVVTVLLELAVS